MNPLSLLPTLMLTGTVLLHAAAKPVVPLWPNGLPAGSRQFSETEIAEYIAVTSDDALRGVNAAQFYIELRKAGVSAELHIYHKGGHGYGIRPSENAVSHWHERCAEWMNSIGLLSQSNIKTK